MSEVPRYPAIRQRKTHCPKGHGYTPENTYWDFNLDGKPYQKCKTCRVAYARLRYRRDPVYQQKRRAHSAFYRAAAKAAAAGDLNKIASTQF